MTDVRFYKILIATNALIPLALKGVAYKPLGAMAVLRRNLLVYGLGGLLLPFAGIKAVDLVVSILHLV